MPACDHTGRRRRRRQQQQHKKKEDAVLPRKRGIRGPTTIWIVQRTQTTGDRRPTPSAMAFLHTQRASTSGHVSDVPLYIHIVDRKIYSLVATAQQPRRQPAQLPRFTPSCAHGPGSEPFLCDRRDQPSPLPSDATSPGWNRAKPRTDFRASRREALRRMWRQDQEGAWTARGRRVTLQVC